MRALKALSKTAAVAIIIAIIIAGLAIYFIAAQHGATTTTTTTTTMTTTTTTTTAPPQTTTTTTPPQTTTTPPATSPTTTTTTKTTTTTTGAQLEVLQIGTSKIHVPRDFYDFVQQVREGKIKVTINFWTSMMPFEVKGIQHVVNEFMKEYPGITVKYTGTVQNMEQAVIAGVMAGDTKNTADVFTWAHDWTGELAEGGYIIPLDKYLPPQTISDLQSQFLAAAFSAGVYKLHVYGLPWAGEAIALVYNKNMVKNPPTTFDEMKAIMEKYYNPQNKTYGLAYQIDPYFVYPFVTAFGGFYYDDQTGKVGVNSTGTIEGIKFLLQNVIRYEYTGDLGHETQLKIFLEGKAPFIITGPWDIPAIKQKIPNIGVVPIPKIGDKIPHPFSGIKLLWITKIATTNKYRLYASLLFVMWFSLNDDTLKYLVDESGFIPVKISLVKYIESHLNDYPIVSGFIKAIAYSIPMPKSPNMAKVWGPVANALNAILTTYSEKGLNAALNMVPQALNEAQKEILKALQKSS